MGIAANQARLMSLTARQSDLELRAQQISAIKMQFAQESSATANAYSQALNEYSLAKSASKTDIDGVALDRYITNAEAAYNTATSEISAQEKLYDMELTQVNTEHTACKTEYDAVKSLIGDNTEKSFNVFG